MKHRHSCSLSSSSSDPHSQMAGWNQLWGALEASKLELAGPESFAALDMRAPAPAPAHAPARGVRSWSSQGYWLLPRALMLEVGYSAHSLAA